MRKRREIIEVLYDIKCEIPGFNKDELIDYIKLVLPNLYNELKNNLPVKTKCKKELIEKVNNNLENYRATKNVDYMSIQYAELYDCIKKDNELYIKVYLSVYFYDNVKNNIEKSDSRNGCWNDIWIVTLKANDRIKLKEICNCFNCGAIMKYNYIKNMFECNYCGTTIYNYSIKEWEITDIEVES